MSVQVLRRLFTVTEYHQMAEAGIFSEDDRVELIEGEVVVDKTWRKLIARYKVNDEHASQG